uniref:LIM zinc-binding domain-containing protein n=2 Tax=Ciona intestinalis TaxID=7719 RepID=H2XLV4_CIOIN
MTSVASNNQSPFVRNFLRKSNMDGAHAEEKSASADEKDKQQKKFSPRRSLRKLKPRKTSAGERKSPPYVRTSNDNLTTQSKCHGCGFVLETGSDPHMSINGVHYHKDCFKCRKCDASLTLKTARKESDGGILCEPCSEDDSNSKVSDANKPDAPTPLYPSINDILRRGPPFAQV